MLARGPLTLDTRIGPFSAWGMAATGPTSQFRVTAFDMRGHGQTPVESE